MRHPFTEASSKALNALFFLIILLFAVIGLAAQPRVSSVSPLTGTPGTTVTITGNNFSPMAAGNIVYFGAVRATVNSATGTSLVVTVPTGATYQPVSVTVNSLTGYSSLPFVITFPGGKDLAQNIDNSEDSFQPEIDSTVDLHPNGVAIADFDGDGKPDVATANNYSTAGQSASVSVIRNTSSPGFISFAPR